MQPAVERGRLRRVGAAGRQLLVPGFSASAASGLGSSSPELAGLPPGASRRFLFTFWGVARCRRGRRLGRGGLRLHWRLLVVRLLPAFGRNGQAPAKARTARSRATSSSLHVDLSEIEKTGVNLDAYGEARPYHEFAALEKNCGSRAGARPADGHSSVRRLTLCAGSAGEASPET